MAAIRFSSMVTTAPEARPSRAFVSGSMSTQEASPASAAASSDDSDEPGVDVRLRSMNAVGIGRHEITHSRALRARTRRPAAKQGSSLPR